MKITIEIPDWAAERHISIMAGMELLAYKPYGKNIIFIKTERCNMCGVCCHMLGPKYPLPNTNDVCDYLVKIGSNEECSKAGFRPWACCWSDPVLLGHKGSEEYCCIRYEKVEAE